ncbi:MAG: hypothetical protein HUU06_06665 [Planctomycetaceae bacterium]|nr:hypothetical protein [Planctomycetota bacterium]NUN52453.1 hypothetical protein [Planctomycetaceae bacterium]
MVRTPALLIASASCAIAAAAFAQDALHAPPPGPPAGAVVRLEADRTDWLLGEDVALRLEVENRGSQPLSLSTGGDYRGTTRPERFTITATREDGLAAEDPAPNQNCEGGGTQTATIPPGGAWFTRVWLASFRVIRDPGTWTVTVHHDLGWKEAPPASLRLRFRPALPFEARLLVAAALATEGEDWGTEHTLGWVLAPHRRPVAPTLRGIYHPEFLPALRDAAVRGEERAVLPIGRISTPEATGVLAALLRTRHEGVAAAAAEALASRIPDPDHPDRPVFLNAWSWPFTSEFDRALVKAWVPHLGDRIRAAAREFVLQRGPALRTAGARLLSRLSEVEDLPAIASALERAQEEERTRGPGGDLDRWSPESWNRRLETQYLRTAFERVKK